MEAIIYLGLLACTWLFVSGANSIQFLKKLSNLHNESKIKSVWWGLVRELVNCAMCTGYWVGLVFYAYNGYSHFFLLACLVSVGSEFFCRLINLIFYKWLGNL